MIEINLETAERAVRAAQAKARELGTPMTISAKAVAAAAFRKPTSWMAEQRKTHEPFWANMPIVRGGRVIGGIGCGGGTGEQDQVCSDAGAQAAGDAKS